MVNFRPTSLNKKNSTSIIKLRFDKKLICFDLVKAFNQIELYPVDQNRLCFLWYQNVSKDDYTIVGYKNLRLSFGLRCSPTLMMLGLYKILILDSNNSNLSDVKRQIYDLMYMDNGAYTTNDSTDLLNVFNNSP